MNSESFRAEQANMQAFAIVDQSRPAEAIGSVRRRDLAARQPVWGRHRTRPRLGSSAPVFDAVVVGCEAVVDAP